MKTLSVRDFFRQPRLVQELVKQGEILLVRHRDEPVFEVRPPQGRSKRGIRRIIGVWSHASFEGDPSIPLPPEQTWR